MRKMHPEIKKFWEDAGYTVSNEDQSMSDTVTATKPTTSYCSIIETVAFGDRHRYNKKWISEEEMLRIIRLKAFL